MSPPHATFDADLARLGRILVADGPSPEPDDWLALARAAAASHTMPALAGALERRGLIDQPSSELGELLRAVRLLNLDRNEAVLRQLEELAATLNAVGIVPVAIKGVGHLVAGTWPDPADRLLRDLDLLVPSEQIAPAVEVLAAVGAVCATSVGPARALSDHHHRPHKHLPELTRPDWRAPVELHYSLLTPGYRAALPADAILARATETVLGHARIAVPCPTDQVLIAIGHGFLAHNRYYRPSLPVRDLLDIVRLHDRHGGSIDWPALTTVLRAAGFGSLVPITGGCIQELTGRLIPLGERPTGGERLDHWRWDAQRRSPLACRLGGAAGVLIELLRGCAVEREVWLHWRRKALEPAAYRRLLARVLVAARA